MHTDRGPDRPRSSILIVDDEALVRAIIRRALDEEGYELHEAVDGRDALERFTREPGRYRLIIMDVIMPHMTGDEAARLVRALDGEVRIIATSGVLPGLSPIEGVDLFLAKPFHPYELQTVVRGLLREQPAHAS